MTGSGDAGYSPQRSVERALAAARCEDCVVIAEETSSANLRWAGNTLTTNGVSQSRRLTVIAVRRKGDEAAAGVVSRSGLRDDQIEEVVRAAEQAAEQSSPAEDAQPLLEPGSREAFGSAGGWDDPVSRTEIGVFRDFTPALGHAFEAAAGRDKKLYGYAEHDLSCVFLGTSSGLRLRHDQPSGKIELNAKSADLAHSAWAGAASRDFTDVDVTAMDADWRGGSGGPGAASSCRPAGTRRCCRPGPWPTCSPTCTGRPGPRMRSTGGRCSASPAAAPGWASSWPACP